MSAMKRILELMVGSTGSGKSTTNERRPAVEIMLNTQDVAEMVAKGDFAGVKNAMEKSMTPGSQTFEDDLARLIREDIMPAAPVEPVYEPASFDETSIHTI